MRLLLTLWRQVTLLLFAKVVEANVARAKKRRIFICEICRQQSFNSLQIQAKNFF